MSPAQRRKAIAEVAGLLACLSKEEPGPIILRNRLLGVAVTIAQALPPELCSSLPKELEKELE